MLLVTSSLADVLENIDLEFVDRLGALFYKLSHFRLANLSSFPCIDLLPKERELLLRANLRT